MIADNNKNNRESNRKKYPALARLVDDFRTVFGEDQVRVIKVSGDWSDSKSASITNDGKGQ